MTTVAHIIDAIEAYAPASLQETWDNTGLQVGHRDAEVTGVLTAVDVTPERVAEAVEAGANMIVSHHPLIFKGLKSITGDNEVQRAVEAAIRHGIAIYSSHTALDNASQGVSAIMAARLGATVLRPLAPSAPGADTGTGVVARLPRPVTARQFLALAKQTFGTPTIRCSSPDLLTGQFSTVALCGGAGGSFIDRAIEAGAGAYVTGDIRHHDFVDYGSSILLVDCGHFETEKLTRDIFAEILENRFPELKITKSTKENNPVTYF